MVAEAALSGVAEAAGPHDVVGQAAVGVLGVGEGGAAVGCELGTVERVGLGRNGSVAPGLWLVVDLAVEPVVEGLEGLAGGG